MRWEWFHIVSVRGSQQKPSAKNAPEKRKPSKENGLGMRFGC